jgi:hypothetical protein
MAGKGLVSPQLGSSAAMLACLASTLANLPLLARSRHRSFIRKAGAHTALVLALGLAGILVQNLLPCRLAGFEQRFRARLQSRSMALPSFTNTSRASRRGSGVSVAESHRIVRNGS